MKTFFAILLLSTQALAAQTIPCSVYDFEANRTLKVDIQVDDSETKVYSSIPDGFCTSKGDDTKTCNKKGFDHVVSLYAVSLKSGTTVFAEFVLGDGALVRSSMLGSGELNSSHSNLSINCKM